MLDSPVLPDTYKFLLRALALTTSAALTLTLAPRAAEACGGMFCDNTPMPMPVDQTGENILFALDSTENTVEAHIQIQYVGDAEKFSWIIPVTAVPEFSVGSEQLFTNMLAATVPSYSLTFQSDCAEMDRGGFGCSAAEDSFAGGTDSGGGTDGGYYGDDDDDDGGVQVLARDIVGPYFVEVLQSGDANELYDWLIANDYAQDDDAPPIVQEYLDEGHYFAAVKLFNGAEVDEIQPLVMKYSGDEPCVPLRLTRIAAVDDMPIRVFFLAGRRAAPTNYKHVLVNPARIDWVNSADNYDEVVTMAADGEGTTEGLAFVTEYAGPSALVSSSGLYDDRWSQLDFAGVENPILTPSYNVIDALEGAGLVLCDFGQCDFYHPMIAPILRQYVPTPAGVAEGDYYSDMSDFEALVDLEAWDGAAFSDEIQQRIAAPGKNAEDLLKRWPYLTRMFTHISPHEMIEDPIFHLNGDLPEVSNTNQATAFLPCRGSTRVVLPNGDEILLNEDGTWPELPDEMPWVDAVQSVPMSGAPQVEQDFRAVISEKLEESNERFDYDDGRGACAVRPISRGAQGLLACGVIMLIGLRGRRRR
ncbi:MAG: DUF2330 domain-containing protein [Myxococcales bacterium]|nr:DUF2330 domain-containing protein [Myxococcales bacterium]MCB9752244.1 DUF2330 domain-containing protein [Myxococcales bacterium]